MATDATATCTAACVAELPQLASHLCRLAKAAADEPAWQLTLPQSRRLQLRAAVKALQAACLRLYDACDSATLSAVVATADDCEDAGWKVLSCLSEPAQSLARGVLAGVRQLSEGRCRLEAWADRLRVDEAAAAGWVLLRWSGREAGGDHGDAEVDQLAARLQGVATQTPVQG